MGRLFYALDKYEMTNIQLATVSAYHAARRNAAWEAAIDGDLAKRAAILRATDYIDETYALRDDVDPDDPRLVRAVSELAFIALTTSLVEVGEAQIIREKVDGVVETQWAEGPIADRFPTISRVLAPLLKPKSVSGFVIARVVA